MGRRSRSLVLVVLLALICATAATAAPPRIGQIDSRMLAGIDAARAQSGLAPVRPSRVLTRDAARYAHTMIARGLWAHALSFQRGTGFRVVGEILARCGCRSGDVGAAISAWLASPEHRPILLGAQFRWVGVAFARGSLGGHAVGVWVVRFGQR